MKLLTYIAIILLFSGSALSQGLRVVDTDLNVVSEVGSEASTVIKIQNTTNHTILLGVKKIENNIRSSQSAKFCINNECISKDIVLEDKTIELLPGHVFSGLTARLETGLVPGSSSVKYRFYNVTNTNESIDVELNYSIREKSKEGILYTSDVVELSDVFPNPVKEKAIFKYTYINPEKEARVVIHSVLGSVIGDFTLSPYESVLTVPVIEYNPGVYFYTLYIDNEGVATKKMVVRK